MNAAVSFVRKHTAVGMTTSQKLYACYNALRYQAVYERFYDKVSITKIPDYAYYQLTTYKGNCYRVASGFGYVAKALGYADVRIASGAVPSHTPGRMSVHGWTEIKLNGIWTMSDVNLQRTYPGLNFYLVTYKAYPFLTVRYEYYYMNVKDGKVSFVRQAY